WSFVRLLPLRPSSTLFPYTTLFRSFCLWRDRGIAPQLRRAHRLVKIVEGNEAVLLRAYAKGDNFVATLPDFFKAGLDARSNTASDRKSTRLNSSHVENSYAVFCLKK